MTRSRRGVFQLQLLATAALALLVPGCVTGDLWEAAGRKHADGVMEGVWAPAGGRAAVVLRYTVGPEMGLTPEHHSYALVPLAPEGKPLPPFRYDGPERVPSRIVAALGEDQVLDLLDTPPDWQTTAKGKAILKSPEFHHATNRRDDGGGGTPGGYWERTFDFQSSAFHPALRVIAFGPKGTEPPRPVGKDDALPPDALIMIIPDSSARPPPDRASSMGQALALTPITVAFDVAMTALSPVFLVLYALRVV